MLGLHLFSRKTGNPDMQTTESWNDTQRLLAFIVVVALIIEILIWMFHPPVGDAGAMAVLNMLLGAHVGYVGAVITFYFGSSKGSKDKDDTISSIARSENGTGGSTSTATVTAATTTAPGSATVTVEPASATKAA